MSTENTELMGEGYANPELERIVFFLKGYTDRTGEWIEANKYKSEVSRAFDLQLVEGDRLNDITPEVYPGLSALVDELALDPYEFRLAFEHALKIQENDGEE